MTRYEAKGDKCCCNCRHDIRSKVEYQDDVYQIVSHCDIDGHRIGYISCFTEWCRHWASDEKYWENK